MTEEDRPAEPDRGQHPVRRPGPVRWVWYAAGGRLPERYREWVLHDVTARHYLWRHAARTVVLLGPLVSVWLLLPGPLWLRLVLCLMAALVGGFYSLAYADENCENRVARHGFAHGTAAATRKAARAERDAALHERYRARYRS
ncbi:DUF5313 family protein [Saccharomonospora halophila]|uniref:DUF5313 family protein n=1 Tax=Saccharomonospora halophila TaxID=129922 RepID=UPI00037B22A6|nr:DUF5313 family protein [Saccharomonospora halophila]